MAKLISVKKLLFTFILLDTYYCFRCQYHFSHAYNGIVIHNIFSIVFIDIFTLYGYRYYMDTSPAIVRLPNNTSSDQMLHKILTLLLMIWYFQLIYCTGSSWDNNTYHFFSYYILKFHNNNVNKITLWCNTPFIEMTIQYYWRITEAFATLLYGLGDITMLCLSQNFKMTHQLAIIKHIQCKLIGKNSFQKSLNFKVTLIYY